MKISLRTLIATSTCGVLFSLAGSSAFAQFTINGNSNTAQTVASGTGLVTTNGTLTLGGSTVAVTMSGTAALTNLGTVVQNGSGRAVDSTASGANLIVFNGSNSLIQSAADGIRVNANNSAITINNYGTISGAQALDLRAITSAANSVVNQSGAFILGVAEDAVRPGVNGTVNNAGTIRATPTVTAGVATGSDGIDAGANSGIKITNTGTIEGRHGITGGATTYALSIDNLAGATLRAVNGSGVNIDGVAATAITIVTNQNGALIEGAVLPGTTNGDGDGVDVDGVVRLYNAGVIHGYGAKGVGSDTLPNNGDAVAAGGGTIINTVTGQIIGSTLLADAPNGDATREGRGILVDDSSAGNAIAATVVDNAGLIQGKSGYGIRFIGNQNDSIVNHASGTIRGTDAPLGAALAVIQMGADDDVLTNSGAILHDTGNSSKAIAMEDGNDTVVIAGGAASVQGGIDGGTGLDTIQLNIGTANTFTTGGSVTNVEYLNANSGKTILTGGSTIVSNVTVAAPADLRVNGFLAAPTLQIAGTLGGTGIVQGVTVINQGGKLSPGNAIGKLTFTGNLDIAPAVSNTTGALQFELASPSTSDLIVVSNAVLTIGSGLLEFTDFDFTNAGVTPGTYTLFATDNAIVGSLGVDVAGVIGGLNATLAFADSHTDLVLTVVPEPSTWVLLLLGVGAFGLRQKVVSRR
ncbi:MAG: hypothetical protein PCFJNLEI_00845 [Verrucomicrobiae bacterium]|nr:hypothetical protein [Verrucomicrobiae bacterium]